MPQDRIEGQGRVNVEIAYSRGSRPLLGYAVAGATGCMDKHPGRVNRPQDRIEGQGRVNGPSAEPGAKAPGCTDDAPGRVNRPQDHIEGLRAE